MRIGIASHLQRMNEPEFSTFHGGCSRVKGRSIKRCYVFLYTPIATIVQEDVCFVGG